jgi:hypothetical protein
MYKLDPQLNILWLSDIHYHKGYSNKEYHKDLKLYLDSFHIYIENLDKDFDYILLSGDIAQEGSPEDYDLFYKDILNPIQLKFSNSKLIVLPGNHDVSRNAVDFIDKFIENREGLDNFFVANKEAFYNVFSPYTSKFINNLRLPQNITSSYKKHLLYGHLLDKKNKTIFVFLNSAWFSFGDIFLKHYFEKNLHIGKDIKTTLVQIKKITSEYGFQSLVLDVIDEIDDIIQELNNYPEYLVVTIMHHPINWFTRKDQITFEKNKFHQIKKFTDLLLTGHDHASIEHPYEYINNNRILHLKAGCFLDFSNECKEENSPNTLNPFIIKENWFSTLEINTKKRTVKQEKHFFDVTSKKWKFIQNNSLLKLNKKHEVVISEDRLNNIKLKLNSNAFKIIQYLMPNENIVIINDYIFRFDNSIIFFINSSNINFTNDYIKEQYNNAKFTKLYVIFCDLFHQSSFEYTSVNNRLLILNKIKTDFDFKFDDFRHNFFSELSVNEAIMYNDLIFINKILPFWDIEHINC